MFMTRPIRAALAALVLSAAMPALAAAPESTAKAVPAGDTVAGTATQLLVSRCLPAVSGPGGVPDAGLVEVSSTDGKQMLGAREGNVWMAPADRILIAAYNDMTECMVIAQRIDLRDLDGSLGSALVASPLAFERVALETVGNGGFAARFESKAVPGLVLDITAIAATEGRPSGAVLRALREDVPVF